MLLSCDQFLLFVCMYYMYVCVGYSAISCHYASTSIGTHSPIDIIIFIIIIHTEADVKHLL